jgi:hypothetical protein
MRKLDCALTGIAITTFLASSAAVWAEIESSHYENNVCSAQNPDACLDSVTGSLEWLRTFGREKFDEDNVSLTVRVPF